MSDKIPFNKPFVAGKELFYVASAVTLGNISGDGHFTQSCSRLLEERFEIPRVLLTPSCTAALEMAAMLCDIGPGDEVLMPSFTFVSTANAFVRLGARPIFVDIRPDTMNLDGRLLAQHITERTKAIVPVHYAGVACEMDEMLQVAEEHNLQVIEDAAQGVNAFYRGRALGSLGALGAYSFHETKNYICGEGGALCINDEAFIERAEIIREKGTNRSQFIRGQVDKYTWVDVGSSYVPSEIVSAFLFAQLELLDVIGQRRQKIYDSYFERLEPLADRGLLRLPLVPDHCRTNCHMFYIVLGDAETRNGLIDHLREQGISAAFHYIPLHTSPMGQQLGYQAGELPITETYSERLLRLPFFYEMQESDVERVVEAVSQFLEKYEKAA